MLKQNLVDKSKNKEDHLGKKNLLEYLLFPIFIFSFFFVIITFDIILKIIRLFIPSLKEWGAYAFNKSVLLSLKTIGSSLEVSGEENLPPSGPSIIISNHQSMFDIPSIHVTCKKLLPRFVAKIELGKGIPGVSACLRISDAALINRSDSGQAVKELRRFAKFIKESKTSAVIFPEGTRARFHTPKPFKKKGSLLLIKETAPVWIIPISIKNSWKLQARKYGPAPLGVKIKLHIHPAVFFNGEGDLDKIFEKIESKIKSELNIQDS